ncbi:MAG: hypothetical protein IKT35_00740 [Clostridia bacterium]|nr:hypothetical protein [Clostridia bacterium]
MEAIIFSVALLLSIYGLATLIVNCTTKLLQPKNYNGDLIVIPICGNDAYSDLFFSYKRIKTDYGRKVRVAVIDCGIGNSIQLEYCRNFCDDNGISIFKSGQFPDGFLCGK